MVYQRKLTVCVYAFFIASMKLQLKARQGKYSEQTFTIVMVGLFLYYDQDCRYLKTVSIGYLTFTFPSNIRVYSKLWHSMFQNTTSLDNQMKHLVYLIENAILNLPEEQEQMAWLIDFTGWSLSNNVPIKSAKDTVNILQNHYPERLAVAFLYNPPRIFEAFWKVCFLYIVFDMKFIFAYRLYSMMFAFIN